MNERRIHTRVEYQLEFECRQYYDPAGVLKRFDMATVFTADNLSAGGLQIFSDLYMPEESVISFTLYLEQIPYVIMGRIRWVVEVSGGWRYGLEFLTIPNALYRHLRDVVRQAADQGRQIP